MSVALAATWDPRGELPRFQRLFAQLAEAYAGIAILLPPHADACMAEQTRELVTRKAGAGANLILRESPEWAWGRHLALQTGYEMGAGHIQYADFDRLLRWVETRPQEWRRAVQSIERSDCLVIGRTQAAYDTHPRALVKTETLSNRVVSELLGRPMDVSAGSKGFSRRAAGFILANSAPGRALGTDGEWPVLAQRAGFRVDYLEVDGLDWESADRYQDQAANLQGQRSAAQAYDADPANWERRLRVAQEIIECGFEAARRSLDRDGGMVGSA